VALGLADSSDVVEITLEGWGSSIGFLSPGRFIVNLCRTEHRDTEVTARRSAWLDQVQSDARYHDRDWAVGES